MIVAVSIFKKNGGLCIPIKDSARPVDIGDEERVNRMIRRMTLGSALYKLLKKVVVKP